MADPIIKIKRSAVPGKIPNTTTLPVGEFAINTYDGKVFIQQDQGGVGIGSTIIVVNPWSVGTGTDTYNTYFTIGNVGIGTTNPTENLSVLGKIQIQQNSGSNNRLIFRGQPGSSYRWNIDNYSSANEFRIFREDDATSANGSVAVSISTTGTLTANKFSGDGSLLTGITAAASDIVVQNQGSAVGTANTLNFSTNLTASFASGTATISLSNNPSISGILTADQVYTSNNGNGTNIRIGDDLWIGDVNIANTTRFSGAQDSTKAFVIFGSSDSVALGRTGTGPLYYGGNFTVSGIVTASSFVKSGGTSSQFLKADGSVDSSIYLTSYTETDTLNSVTGRGNVTANGISVGVLTATSGNFSGIITSSGANISGVTTSGGFNATTGNTYQINGTSVLSSNTLGSGVVNSSLTSVGTLTNLNVGNINSTGIVTASSFVGNLTGTATSTTNIPNLTGDVTSVNTTTTLATVNNNVGTFGSSTSIPSITVNAKGLVTGVTTSAITVGDGTLTLNVAGVGLTGSQTFSANQGSNATFTVTSNATSDNTNGAIVSRNGAGGFSAGIITATSFSGSLSGTATNANFIDITTNSTDNNVYYIPFESGIGYTSLYIDSGLTYNPGQDLLSLNNLSATNITVNQGINATGVITASSFVGTLIGVASSATQLQNARTISLSGDVVGSVSFDGTQNVSIAATIQPDSVALGSDTTGDYVQSISGTSNQITVTSGTGEGSTPTLSIPSQFTAPQDVTVTRDLQVNRNLNVNGNITIGGTAATLFTTEFKVYDPDIVLGFRTDGSGNDVSNDNTANHGGIAIASTEGTPLISLYDVGVGETNPATYKKFMWFKSGTFSGLGTDAWLSNYAIGIGSTQVPNGVRLAAGSVQFTERDLTVVRNINASGVVTASSFSGNLANTLTLNTSGTGLSGSTTFNNSGAATFTVTSNATSSNTNDAIVARDGAGGFNAGIITATSFVRSGGTSSQFLKADGSVDSSTYLTSYTETDTLDTVTGRGNSTSNGISVGVLTATSGNFSGIITSSGVVISGISTFQSDVYIGSQRIFENTTNLFVRSPSNIFLQNTDGSNYASFIYGGEVRLYYGNLKTFETTGFGATVFGVFQSQGLQISGITTSNGFNATTGNTYQINGTTVLSSNTLGSGVVNSSLTSVGTLGQLNVTGITTSSRFVSDVATGTAPISVASTTKVTNLNVDLLDDQDGAYYLNYNNFTNTPTIGNGTLTLAVSGTGLSGSQSFTANQTGNATFTVTSNATSDNTNSTIVARDASGGFSAGIITATLSGTATTATNLADAANITTGTINSARLSGTYNIDISGSAGYATTAGIATVAQGLTGTPNITVGIVTATSLNVGAGGTVITTTDSGLVGIGITNPTSKLHVVGDAIITGISSLSQISAGGTTGTSGQVLQSTGTGLAWATPSSGGSSNLTGISTLGFFGDDQNITSNLDLPENALLYTVHKNINVATGSTITVGSGTTIVMDRFNNLDDVVATSFKGDGSQLTGIPVGDLYELDQISPAGGENTYTPTFNYETVAVTNPFRLLISIDGILQSAYIHNTEYVFNNSLLTSRTGYTIDYDGNIKFTEALPEGSEVMIKTTAGTTKSTTRRYPFNALDILF